MSQIQVDNIYNKEATGGPNFPLGANVTGVVTATTFKGGAEITSGTISATSATFSGAVSVGGTLTYEDVTNIDSVGVITARNGVKVTASGIDIAGGGINAVGVVTATNDIKANGNIIGDSSTNISGVSSVTATTYYGSGTNLTGIDPAPTVTATADGAITAGDSVILNSNGTVTKTKETYSAVSPIGGFSSGDTNIPNNSDETSEWQTCKIKDNYMLAGFKRGNGSNTVRVKQIYIPTGGTAVVSGTEGTLSGSNAYFVDAAHDPDRDQAVILYLNSDNKLYVRTIRSTGTSTLNWGNEVAVSTNAGQSAEGSVFLSYDPTSSKFLIVYAKDPDNSSYATAQTMTVVDNNTYTFGSKVTFKSNTCTNAAVSYDSTAGKHLIVYRDDSISNDSYGIVATVSGTNVSFGTAVELETGDNKASKLAYSTTDNKHIWMYNDETGSRLDVSTLTVSGTTVSRGAVSTITVTAPSALNDGSINATYDPTLNKFYLLYPNNYIGKMTPATLSGTSVTLGTETNSRLGNGVADVDLAYDSSSNRFLFVLQNGATNAGLYQIWHTSNASTNITEENYIGIARNTVADTDTATIDVSGATNSNQSSLTPGQNYFVQNNGTLGLDAATPKVYAGTAVSATKLLVGKSPSPSAYGSVIEEWTVRSGNTGDMRPAGSGCYVSNRDSGNAGWADANEGRPVLIGLLAGGTGVTWGGTDNRIISFPSTGIWEISFNGFSNSSSQQITCEIQTTPDDNTYTIAKRTACQQNHDSREQQLYVYYRFNVTNTATHKVQILFKGNNSGSASLASGSGSSLEQQSYNTLTFMKIA